MTPRTVRSKNERRVPLAPSITQIGSLLVILTTVFAGIQKIASLVTAVETLQDRISNLDKTTATLVVSVDGQRQTVANIQNHLRLIDQQQIEDNIRLAAVESYLLTNGKHTAFKPSVVPSYTPSDNP